MQRPSPLEMERDAASGRPAEDRLSEVASAIRAGGRFALLTHVNPDGDALGSLVALALGLRSLGKEARAYVLGGYPEKFEGLFPSGLVEVLEEGARPVAADVCILLDTGEPARAGALRDFLLSSEHKRICIDHHPAPSVKGFDATCVVTRSPSTGNLILEILDRLGVPVDRELARALWIAIATDTGWFRFANTSSWALRDAARLVERDVDVEALHQRIYGDLTPARARVLGHALSAVQTELGGRLVTSVLPRKVYAGEGLEVADLDGMVDYIKTVRGAQVIAFVVEIEEGCQKVSLRALRGAEVESIARRSGGGGHAAAAGYRFRGTAEDAIRALAGELQGRLGA